MNNEFLKTKKAFKYMQYSAKYFKGDIIILPIRCNKKINKYITKLELSTKKIFFFPVSFFLFSVYIFNIVPEQELGLKQRRQSPAKFTKPCNCTPHFYACTRSQEFDGNMQSLQCFLQRSLYQTLSHFSLICMCMGVGL